VTLPEERESPGKEESPPEEWESLAEEEEHLHELWESGVGRKEQKVPKIMSMDKEL
jgi:hypothetical protein